MPALPVSPSEPLSSSSTPQHNDPAFSWKDTLGIAFASCTPSSSSSSPFGACFPCLRRVESDDSLNQHAQNRRPAPPGIRRAREDELRGLLSGDGDDDSVPADELSLHSNFGPGSSRRRRRQRRKSGDQTKKSITLFGFDLFGRKTKPAPIHLGDEADDALYGDGGDARSGRESLGSLGVGLDADSDAEPLSRSVIDSMGVTPLLEARDSLPSPTTHQQAPSPTLPPASKPTEAPYPPSPHSQPPTPQISDEDVEAQKRREKEERRAARRARKALERLKAQGVLPEDKGGEEFEGFQGSGSMAPPHVPSAATRRLVASRSSDGSRSRSGTTSTGTGSWATPHSAARLRSQSVVYTSSTPVSPREEDFGDFVDVKTGDAPPPTAVEVEDDVVDLDGGLYAGSSRKGYRPGGGSRGSGSGSASAPGVGGHVKAHRKTHSSSTGSSGARGGHGAVGVVGMPSPLGYRSSTRHGGSQHSGTASQPGTPSSGVFADPLSHPSSSGANPHRKRKKTSSSRQRSTVASSSRTSESPSLASPSEAGFEPDVQAFVSPSTVEQGLGFFDAEDMVSPLPPPTSPPAFMRKERRGTIGEDGRGFPSTGIGRRDSRAGRERERRAAEVFGAGADGL